MDKNLKNVILKLVEEVMAEAPAPVIEPPTKPADAHHCAEPLGFTPIRFLFAKLGALGRTRTYYPRLNRP